MTKDFDRWNEKKKGIHSGDFTDFVHAREVWWCAVGVNIGVESDGKHDNFERPVLIIRKFSRDAVLVVPITSRIKDNLYYIVYKHQEEQFAAMISQVRLISTKRLIRKIFSMDSATFRTICDATGDIIINTNKRPPLTRGPRRSHDH